MKAGNFTDLALDYARYRPDYSAVVLDALLKYNDASSQGSFAVADVGAGTGIWSKMLAERGLSCTAVEPNNAMRAEGEKHTQGTAVRWLEGSGENTGVEDSSMNWVTMASSFHWVDLEKGLKEFSRILKPNGFLTVLWNPRNIESSPQHVKIENIITEIVPELKRVSSGNSKHVRDYHKELVSTGEFKNSVFFEALHEIRMTKERYIGVWRSVNDIQVQAGPERFEKIISRIEDEIRDLDEVVVPYKTRAWTVQKVN